MNKYSPISKIMIKNFQNIDELTLDFKKSPIIALVGDNESGKTSAIKAFSVCSLHHNPRGQNEYIRDNTNMFGVAIELADGTLIVRQKDQNTNAYRVIKNGQVVWQSAKITDGLPSIIQDVMGMVAEPETKEYLQIRSYEDKLLFVVTPASVNYKVMYNSLKVEQLTKAIKLGNTEVNSLKNKIASDEVAFDTLHGQLSGLQVLDLEQASIVKDRLATGLQLTDKLERARSLQIRKKQLEDSLGVVRIIDTYGLEELPVLHLEHLARAYKVMERYSNISKSLEVLKDVDSFEQLDCTILNRIRATANKISRAGEIQKENESLVALSTIEDIDTTLLLRLNNAMKQVERLREVQSKCGVVDMQGAEEVSTSELSAFNKIAALIKHKQEAIKKKEELEHLDKECNKIIDILTSYGVAFETCSNCGAPVIIDLDKFKSAEE